MNEIPNPASGILDLAADKEKIASFLAHQEETGKKQHDPDQFAAMEAYLYSDEYPADLERLKQGDYFFPAPFHYRITKSTSGKKRDVYAFKGAPLYILRMVSWVMHDYDDTMFPPGLYSFRRNIHGKDFLRKIRSFRNLNRFWIVKSDVSNYVGSIVPELIIPRLEQMWGHDPALLGLLKFLLLRRECIERDGTVVACEPGGLGGLPVANFFMNVYLMEMDWYFSARSPLYCRYSDDIVFLARSREEAEDYLKTFYQILEEKRLYTNPAKTQLIEPGGAVEILGFLVRDGVVDLSDHAIDKIYHKIRTRANRLLRYKKRAQLEDRVVGEKMVRFCNRVFFGTFQPHELCWARWYFPIITTTDRLKQVDRYAQDAIRLVMNGSMHKRRYNVRYEDLQALGYRSLVHAYYHTDPEHWL